MSLFSDPDERPDHFTNDSDDTSGAAPQPQRASDPGDPFAPVSDKAPAPTPAPRRRSRFGRFITISAIIIIVALGVCCYIRYFAPYATDAVITGYVQSVERRGIVFRTYEGELLTHENMADTSRVYQRDFRFSVASDTLARAIQDMQGTGLPVTLVYERYYASLPWRGSSTNIVTAIR